MIFIGDGSAPGGHDSIANEFDDDAVLFKDSPGGQAEVGNQDPGQFTGRQSFGHIGEAFEVGEHNGRFNHFPTWGRIEIAIRDLVGHVGRGVSCKRAAQFPAASGLDEIAIAHCPDQSERRLRECRNCPGEPKVIAQLKVD